WKEKGTGFTHIYAPVVNIQTGEIYLDCSKKKIYAKIVIQTLLRPFLSVIKTAYHLAIPISIIHIIYTTIQERKKYDRREACILENCIKNSLKSIADIVRTPVYGVAIIIVGIAIIIIGPFAPNTLYTSREILGKLMKSLYWSVGAPIPCINRDLFLC